MNNVLKINENKIDNSLLSHYESQLEQTTDEKERNTLKALIGRLKAVSNRFG